jgi:hypothetical protein
MAAHPSRSGADTKRLSVRIITPERIAYDQPADAVVATATDGEFGILPGHAPMMVVLGVGEFHPDGGPLRMVRDRRGSFTSRTTS